MAWQWTPTAALFWSKVKYVGIAIVPMAWLVYILRYTGREKWLTRRTDTYLATPQIDHQ